MSFLLRDIRWFSELVLNLHAAGSEPEMFKSLVRALNVHFQPLCSVAEEVAYSMSSYQLHCGVVHFEFPDYLLPAFEDSPMVVRWRARQCTDVLHLSAMTPQSMFHRTIFYNAVCKRIGLEDQLIGTFQTAPGIALNFSVSRDALFSESERTLMAHIRDHVEACLIRLRRSSPHAACGAALELPVQIGGPRRRFPSEISSMLSHYFPAGRREIAAGQLPDELLRWTTHSFAALRAQPPLRPLSYLRTGGPRGYLYIRLFPARSANSVILRFTEELTVPSVLALRRHGLTERECEVLHWLMSGKRNREIGTILGCSERTVAKHVEALIRKTGAGGRQAVVHAADGWLKLSNEPLIDQVNL